MSLVHEALQKAAREKHRHADAPTPIALPAPAPAPSAPRAVLPVVVGGVVVIGMSVVAGWLWWPARESTPAQPAPQPAPAAKIAVPAVVPSAPVQRYEITGIVRMPDGVFTAIVNGRTVYEDGYVDGAVVKKIEADRVTLEVDGRPVVVRYR